MGPLFLIFLTILTPGAVSLDYIIYVNAAGQSHFDFAASIVDTLVERGHNVDLLIALINTNVKWKGRTKARNVETFGFDGPSPWMTVGHLNDPFEYSKPLARAKFQDDCLSLCARGLESGKALSFLKAGKYDAGFAVDFDFCSFILFKAAGIEKVLSYSSLSMVMQQSVFLGVPSPVNVVATNFDPYNGDFSLFSRFGRLYYWFKYLYIDLPRQIGDINTLARKHFGPDFASADELARNSCVMFINSNELTETPRTITHKVQYIGGMNMKAPKALSTEFEGILSKNSKGTVIVSFGTQVPPERFNMRVKSALFNTFRQFPDYQFIWKYTPQLEEDREFLENTENVKFVDWLPQTDLLYDKRVVGFITHAGLNSFLEFTHSGTPVVIIPLFADQETNARNAVRLGVGIQLNKITFTEQDLAAALRKILSDDSIMHRSKELATTLKNQPFEAKERLIKWAEFVANTPNLHTLLNLPEAGMSPLFYYGIDLVFILLGALILLLAFISFLFWCTVTITRSLLGRSRGYSQLEKKNRTRQGSKSKK